MNNVRVEYHIFTNNTDHWTQDLEEALMVAQDMYESDKCVRIYKNTYEEDDTPVSEFCLFAVGDFPY